MRAIYTAPDAREALDLLDKYDIQYIVVGPRERSSYGASGLAKLRR